jgi:acetoin utilization protein AcuB
MNVSDLMTPNPTTVQQDATLRSALEMMELLQCHHLPVITQHGTLVGVLSSHDCRQALNLPSIVRRRWEENKLIDHLLVSSVMSIAPVIVYEHTPVEEAVRLMMYKQVGCLPVMRSGKLVGIVTNTDFLRAFAKLALKHAESAPV